MFLVDVRAPRRCPVPKQGARVPALTHRSTAMFMIVAFVFLVVAIVRRGGKVMCRSTREAIKRLAIRPWKHVRVDVF